MCSVTEARDGMQLQYKKLTTTTSSQQETEEQPGSICLNATRKKEPTKIP